MPKKPDAIIIVSCWSISSTIILALLHASQHLPVKLHKKLDFAPLEKLAAGYHHQSGPGSPATHPPSKLVRAILVKYLYDLSLRETEERLYSDMIIRWFVGYSLFETPPDHTTLECFELWLKLQQHTAVFDVLLSQIRQDMPDGYHTQTGDTYAMQATAAREQLGTLLRHLSQNLLAAGLDSLPVQMETVLRGFDWPALFGTYPEKLDYKLDKAQREERLLGIAKTASDLHRRFITLLQDRPATEFPALRTQLGYLGKVLRDEFSHTNGQIRRLPPNETGSFRLGSASDPQASYRVHGPDAEDTTLGYNVQVAASKTGFISETRAYTGADQDQAGVTT